MESYKVICSNCGQSDVLAIENNRSVNWGKIPKYVISARKRFDGVWGWQCLCGNNDLWSATETRYIKDKVNPDPLDIKTLLNNLKVEKPKFVMEKI